MSPWQAQLSMLLFYFLQTQQRMLTNCENQLDVFMSVSGNSTCTLLTLL